MKVMMLGWELPPYNSGGLGMASYQLCRFLAKNGVDIEFVLPYKAEHKIDFMKITPASPEGVVSVERLGVAYDTLKYVYPEESKEEYYDLFSQVKMYEEATLRLALTKNFDILHAHDWLTFRAALRIKEIKNCPIILHVHSVESDRAGHKIGNPLIFDIEELALNLADRVIAVSEHTKQSIIQNYNVPADKIEVVHNSINVEELIELDPNNVYRYLEYIKQKGYKVITNIGRLTLQKGLTNLIRALSKVKQYYPKVLLLIVGSGDQYYELIELSASLGVAQNVLFTDFQRGKNWRDALAIGNLFVLPSVSEPFGLTPLESIAYKTPALISKQSGVSEVLKNVLKVDFWDIDEMTNQIVGVLENQALENELQKNSYKEVEEMSWEHSSNKIEEIYRNHLQGVVG
ncbi:MAG: glycosyltransferase family 4 protein [Patescibacteria group bacterium]|jgi:glycosyltransferase involved in cell wall biosynthesis|nr:glycosyltransferase family 4 protein [Patescibacteria group bacterium]